MWIKSSNAPVRIGYLRFMYVVLDVESTGGAVNKESIIEIALFRFDGEKIVDQLISLVHTDKPIQPYVQKMTGIVPSMLRSAPRWHEIAKRVVEITEDAILVGHGVSFDYRMVRQEFERLGYPYERATIDTVNWSRKLFPGEDSYKLTSLCESLGIWLPRNHRAGDDARATVELFRKLLDKDVEGRIHSLGKFGDAREKPAERLQKLLREVRNEPGIYYLYDSQGKLLRSALAEKMHGELSRTFLSPEADDVEIQQKAAKLRTEPTGTRLLAQLKLHEEKRLLGKDELAHGQQGAAVQWNGDKHRFEIQAKVPPAEEQLVFFKKMSDARKWVRYSIQRFGLCPERKEQKGKFLCGMASHKHACPSKCVEERSRQEFGQRSAAALKVLRMEQAHMQLTLPGRKRGEKVLIEVENGQAFYLFFQLEKELADTHSKQRNRVRFELDPFIRGLLWRAYIRQGPKAVLAWPDSLALNKSQ